MASQLVCLTADGQVRFGPTVLKSLILAAADGSDSIATIYDGVGVSGILPIIMKAVAGETVVWQAADPHGALFGGGIYATMSGGVMLTAEVA